MSIIQRSDGRAAVKVKRQWIYLGGPGAEDADQRYRTLCAVRRLGGDVGVLRWSVADVQTLCGWYLNYCAGYYVKRDRPTSTLGAVRCAFQLLRECGPTGVHPEQYGPSDLKNFQRFLCRRGLSAQTVNVYTGAVQRMFQWAASEELVSGPLWQSLLAVKRVQAGRSIDITCPAPAGPVKRRPVPDADFDAVVAHCPPLIADMARLEWATAMRPEEVCYARWCDIVQQAPDLWVYTPSAEGNKLAHQGIDRTVYLGPEAIAILQRHLPRPGEEVGRYIFSPKRTMQLRHQLQREQRATPLYPSHLRRLKKKRAAEPQRTPRDHYTTDAYTRALKRAGEKAGLPPDRQWSSGRLRHTGASRIANATDIFTAQQILGHTDARTTRVYVTVKHDKAAAAARRLC